MQMSGQSQKFIHDIENLDNDHSDLVNNIQRHTCNSAYCLRQKNGKTTCRFDFPFDTCEKTHLKFSKVNTKDGSLKYRFKN